MNKEKIDDLEALASKYRDAALEWGRYQQAREFNKGNSSACIIDGLGKILGKSSENCKHLLRLLDDPDPYVVVWAAKDCLPFYTQKSLAVLDGIARKKGLLGTAAATTISEWKAGKLFHGASD